MKKTSTRLAAIGGVITLGACAIALAQHDARKRAREAPVPQAFEPGLATPITVASIDPSRDGSYSSLKRPVTSEDAADSAGVPNPLRSASSNSQVEHSVILASAQADGEAQPAAQPTPALPTKLPTAPPARSSTQAQPPVLGLPNSAVLNRNAPSASQSTMAALPQLPTSPGGSPGGASAAQRSAANTGSAALPPTAPALPGRLSDKTPPPAAASAASAGSTHRLSSPTPLPPSSTGAQPAARTNPPSAYDPSASSRLSGGPNGSNPSNQPPAGSASSSLRSNPTTPFPPRGGATGRATSSLSDTQYPPMRPTELTDRNSASGPASAAGDSAPAAQQRYPRASASTGRATQPQAAMQQPAQGQPRATQPQAVLPTDAPATYDQRDPRATTATGKSSAVQQLTAPPTQSQYATSAQPTAPASQTSHTASSRFTSPATAATAAQTGYSTSRSSNSLAGGYAASSGPVSRLANLVSDTPGNSYLDGSQSPRLVIEKRAPQQTQVGKPATFMIIVRNEGDATAHGVTVVDKIPRGARFGDAEPAVKPTAEGILVWDLGEISAGAENAIRLSIIPEVEGEVGSTASVHFAAQASVRTLATQPKLEMTLEASPNVMIGDFQQVIVNIQNVGSGIARDVQLEVDVPGQLRHESGVSQLGAALGDLHPNQSHRITNLSFTAIEPGQAQCVVRAVSPDGYEIKKSIQVDVRSPKLLARISGPKLRHLERHATFSFAVANQGTATATNLEFAVHLPQGLKYVSTDQPAATYEPQSHTVNVALEDLPAGGKPAEFRVTLLPVQMGVQAIALKATADLGLTAEASSQVAVEGLADLEFKIDRENGSIEAGATTTYSVSIANIGSKPDSNVQLAIQLPPGAEIVNFAPQVLTDQRGDIVVLEPIARFNIGDSRTYRFEVRHNQVGTQVVHTKLTSGNLGVGIIKEVGTFVYDGANN